MENIGIEPIINRSNSFSYYNFVVLPGLEPGLTVSETVVLAFTLKNKIKTEKIEQVCIFQTNFEVTPLSYYSFETRKGFEPL